MLSTPSLLLEKNPTFLVALYVNAKSSFEVFTGSPTFIASEPLFKSILKTSKPPNPVFPFDEKNNTLSSVINGKLSFASVFTFAPKFSGVPYSSPFTDTFQISSPPKPPGMFDEKYNVFPSLLMLGFLTSYSLLLKGSGLLFDHVSPCFVALYK